MNMLTEALLWFALISAGLMAGLYFAFSVFIMYALAALDHPAGMQAMNAINFVIQRTIFLPLFFASTAASMVLCLIALINWGAPGTAALLLGGILYVVGMSGVTIAGNVPLNNALASAAPRSLPGHTMWLEYCRRWTRLNHVRTIACTAALALFVLAEARL